MYRSGSIRFDPIERVLWHKGRARNLRPKAATLLAHLLSDPQRIHAKAELVEAVWGHAHVEDQALFQLVSEIRNEVGEARCLVTHPGRGYCWAWPVRPVRGGRRHLAAMLAALLLVAGGLGLFWRSASTPPAGPGMSPAMVAVSEAMQARAEGRVDDAVEWLQLAVEANPQFAAARLELADALRAAGDIEQAQVVAHDALSAARVRGDHYLEATAYVLLSKLRMSAGDLSGAIQANAEAARIADDHGHICAAQVSADWQQQLAQALLAPGTPPAADQSVNLARCEDALRQPGSDLFAPPGQALTLKG